MEMVLDTEISMKSACMFKFRNRVLSDSIKHWFKGVLTSLQIHWWNIFLQLFARRSTIALDDLDYYSTVRTGGSTRIKYQWHRSLKSRWSFSLYNSLLIQIFYLFIVQGAGIASPLSFPTVSAFIGYFLLLASLKRLKEYRIKLNLQYISNPETCGPLLYITLPLN